MELQVRCFGKELTPEQDSKEDLYYHTVNALKKLGIRAKYVKTVSFSDTDNPGYIILE